MSVDVRSSQASGADSVRRRFERSLAQAKRSDEPYRHWMMSEVFPEPVVDALASLPFEAPDLGGVSGARELHNDTRSYFDEANQARFSVCADVAAAFQQPEMLDLIETVTGADLDECFLRIEYATDIDGFWLKPHTDLGVKRLTLLYYLGGDGQSDLGTDVYAAADAWSLRSDFRRNGAMMFVPSDHTWHGFEPRPIQGVRKSVIINYVTDEWRAREQLAYPAPVRASRSRRTA
ncbi:MAG: 2OG-Fe(II) oxygenase [Bryobacteraceae bacterium]